MLQTRQVKQFILTTLSPQIHSQLPPQLQPSSCLLTLSLTLDLLRVFRKHNPIALFLIGHYPHFLQLIQQCACDCLSQQNLPHPQYGVQIRLRLSNCPLPTHNIESVGFLTAALDHSQGVVVYLKHVYILTACQPQMYLFSWGDVYSCACQSGAVRVPRRQTLIQAAQHKHLREAAVEEKCPLCGQRAKHVRRQNQVYLNCSKVMGVAQMRSGDKEEIFHCGAVTIYTEGNTVREGDVINGCFYVSVKVVDKRPALRIHLICSYAQSSVREYSLYHNIGLRQEVCECVTDYDTIEENYSLLMQSINKITYPYVHKDTRTLLKLSTLVAHANKLHLLLITEEVNIVQKALQIYTPKKWPTLYDTSTLKLYLSSCYDSIMLVTNPTIKDISHINRILNRSEFASLCLRIWVVMQPNKELKRNFQLQHIYITLDLSAERNSSICHSSLDSLLDLTLNAFMAEEEVEQYPRTIAKQTLYPPLYPPLYSPSQNKDGDVDEVKEKNQEKMARDLLQRYYLRSREYKAVSCRTIEGIMSVAEGVGRLRMALMDRVFNQSINVLDAVVAMLLEEQSCRVKYSSSNTFFANQVSKLMLNEDDCELSFWEYEVDENEDVKEYSRKIDKGDMFKRMVYKIITLLYEQQI